MMGRILQSIFLIILFSLIPKLVISFWPPSSELAVIELTLGVIDVFRTLEASQRLFMLG
jgi:hypothetical protein